MVELLTTFGIDWRLLVIQMVNFGVLLAALSYLLYKPVLTMLAERQAAVEKGVRDAEAAAMRLKEADHEKSALIGKAAAEAETIVAHARTHAVERGSQIEEDAKERADRMIKDAAEKTEAMKVAAMNESKAAIAQAAVLAAEQILKEKK